MNRPAAWTTPPARITVWLSGWLFAWCGCAQWPAAPAGPDLTQAGGSRLEMAQMSERLGRADLAEKFYRDVLAQQPDQPLAHHRLAALAARDGRWQEADEHFRLARRSGPPSADLLTDLAYAQYQRRQLRAAEGTLRQALKIDPQHAKSRSLLALVLNEQGRFREGLAEFRQAVRGIEGQGGAADVYGAAVAAGSAPAPRPSAERTDRQLAAAGVRSVLSEHDSPGDSVEEAEERSLARDATSPPATAPSAPSAKRSTAAGERSPLKPAPSARDRVTAKPSPSQPSRPSVLAAAPVRLPPPPELSFDLPAEHPVAEHSVIVRLDPTDVAPMPTTLAAKPAANPSASVTHGAGESADDSSRSRVEIKNLKKDAAVAPKHTHGKAAERSHPAPASQVATEDGATELRRNPNPECQAEQELAEAAPRGEAGAPALIAPAGSITASEQARDADRPVLARPSDKLDEHPSTMAPTSPPMDRGVLSRSLRRARSSSPAAPRGNTAAAKTPTSSIGDSASPSATMLASFEEPAETPSVTPSTVEPKRGLQQGPTEAAASPDAASATAGPPAGGTTGTKPPAPATPAMSLPVGLDFSLPVRATSRPAPSAKRP